MDFARVLLITKRRLKPKNIKYNNKKKTKSSYTISFLSKTLAQQHTEKGEHTDEDCPSRPTKMKEEEGKSTRRGNMYKKTR